MGHLGFPYLQGQYFILVNNIIILTSNPKDKALIDPSTVFVGGWQLGVGWRGRCWVVGGVGGGAGGGGLGCGCGCGGVGGVGGGWVRASKKR